jgi:hypothetical protein
MMTVKESMEHSSQCLMGTDIALVREQESVASDTLAVVTELVS